MAHDEEKRETPGGEFVNVEFDDGIAWVAINRPEKRNAISPQVVKEMVAVLDALEIDDRCGVLVLTGTGESFHSGMDIKEYFRANEGQSYEWKHRMFRMNGQWQWRNLMHFPKPTIAMVNGWCFGAGLNPVVACDLAIAADDAVFGVSEINWGIVPAGNVVKSLSAALTLRDTLYHVMTGETFDGRRAAEMRLVNFSVPRAQLRERTEQLARVLLEKNPHALRACKDACRRVRNMSWEDANDYLYAKNDQSRYFDSSKGREAGMSQFLDEKSFKPGLGAYRRDD